MSRDAHFKSLIAKLSAGTLTLEEATTSSLSAYERQSLVDGMVERGYTVGAGSTSTHAQESGDQAAAPTGVWSSWVIAVPSSSAEITVNGIPVPAGSSISGQASTGRTIPSPTIVDGGNNYNWFGYRI